MNTTRRHRYAGLLSVVGLLVLPLATTQADDISWEIGAYPRFYEAIASPDAKPIVYTEDRAPRYVLTRFVIEGESADEWIEAFEILDAQRKGAPRTVEGWYEQFHQQGEQHCPGGNWEVLARGKNSITFERHTLACDGFAEQHALYRVLYGKHEIFSLVATRKGSMDEATRSGWLGVLESARVQ